MWPDSLPRSGGVKLTPETLLPVQKIPETRAAFHSWARPVQNPRPVDSTRGWIMAVIGLSTPTVRCELTVVLHGFVTQRQLALEQTGNRNKQ